MDQRPEISSTIDQAQALMDEKQKERKRAILPLVEAFGSCEVDGPEHMAVKDALLYEEYSARILMLSKDQERGNDHAESLDFLRKMRTASQIRIDERKTSSSKYDRAFYSAEKLCFDLSINQFDVGIILTAQDHFRNLGVPQDQATFVPQVAQL